MSARSIGCRLGWLAVSAVVLAVSSPPVHPQAAIASLLPVDEAVSNPEFFAFRARLQGALARHDVEALMAVVDPHVKNSFGGDDGAEAFRKGWRLDEPGSRLWAALATVVALGGSFQARDTFVAPYTFSKWPEPFDSFEHVVLTASNVRVRTRPAADAPVAAVLSFAILKIAGQDSDAWRAVKLDEGRIGYVSSSLTRSPIDYRAHFTRSSGQWRLTLFLAGD